MKLLSRITIVAAACSVLAASSFAASITGKWTGHIKPPSAPPANFTPAQQKQYAASVEQVKKMTISLELKANKTFTMTNNFPKGAPSPHNATQEGTWSQTGSKVTFVITPAKEFKNAKPRSVVLDVDKSNKTMVINDHGVTITFNR